MCQQILNLLSAFHYRLFSLAMLFIQQLTPTADEKSTAATLSIQSTRVLAIEYSRSVIKDY